MIVTWNWVPFVARSVTQCLSQMVTKTRPSYVVFVLSQPPPQRAGRTGFGPVCADVHHAKIFRISVSRLSFFKEEIHPFRPSFVTIAIFQHAFAANAFLELLQQLVKAFNVLGSIRCQRFTLSSSRQTAVPRSEDSSSVSSRRTRQQ